MVVAEPRIEHAAHLAEPAYEDLLRLFAAICALPAVGRIALTRDGSAVTLWVLLTEDDEQAEHRIYEAEGQYLASEATPDVELRVIFADEDESAFPVNAPVLFSRPSLRRAIIT